jgi:hypothetical protein
MEFSILVLFLGVNYVEKPLFKFVHSKDNIILFKIVRVVMLLLFMILSIQGIVERIWFYFILGIISLSWTYWFFRIQLQSYIAIYPHKIVIKKYRTKEVLFNHVTEVKYFKKYLPKSGYIDCLNFYFENQKPPILINPSFIGAASPFVISEETRNILVFIKERFPNIKITRVEWEELNII